MPVEMPASLMVAAIAHHRASPRAHAAKHHHSASVSHQVRHAHAFWYVTDRYCLNGLLDSRPVPEKACDCFEPQAWPYDSPQPSGLERLLVEPGYPPHDRAPGVGELRVGDPSPTALPSPYTRFGVALVDVRGVVVDALV